MIDLIQKDFTLAVQDSNNPRVTITAKPNNGAWDITVQPYGSQSFKQCDKSHDKVKCFLSFLQSSGFYISAQRSDEQSYCYEQHVASYEEANELLSKTDAFLKKNNLVLH